MSEQKGSPTFSTVTPPWGMEGPLGTHCAEAKSMAHSGFCTRPSSTQSLQGYYYH